MPTATATTTATTPFQESLPLSSTSYNRSLLEVRLKGSYGDCKAPTAATLATTLARAGTATKLASMGRVYANAL